MPELDSVWYPTQLEVTRPYILKEYVFRELIRKEERWVTQAFLPVRLWLSNELEVRDLTFQERTKIQRPREYGGKHGGTSSSLSANLTFELNFYF